jgi:putative serine protease PepD
MHRRAKAASALLAAAAVGAGSGAGIYAAASGGGNTAVQPVAVPAAQPAARTTGADLSVNEIYQGNYKGVVEITVSSTQSSPYGFGGPQRQEAQGSGFVYDSKGDIVTNQHVVDGASSISVRFWNGATYSAQLVGADPSTDLAVIRVDAPTSVLSPLTLGDSNQLQVGDGIVAIGSPFGLEETVTSGIVSALHRSISSPNDFTIPDSIQTDAAINHGNSGGPLLNTQGQVVAVAAQIESDSGGNDGVGFGIPSTTVRSVVGQLLANGKVAHAYLGIGVETIPPSVASQLSMAAGVEITQVRAGTPAAKAGLHGSTGQRLGYPTGGDVITRVDGKRVTSAEELQNAIGSRTPGTTVSITYVRAGQTHVVQVTLASRPS